MCVRVCVCVWCVSAPEPHPKHERQRRTNIWGCVIISVLQMCHDPPFGTVRVNPISRGINGRPTAVEKDAGTWLFWLTSSESDEGCGSTLGGESREEATEVDVARIGEARLYFACCREVSPHSERYKTHSASSGWFLRGLENTNKTTETTESQTVTRLRKNTELSNTTR